MKKQHYIIGGFLCILLASLELSRVITSAYLIAGINYSEFVYPFTPVLPVIICIVIIGTGIGLMVYGSYK